MDLLVPGGGVCAGEPEGGWEERRDGRGARRPARPGEASARSKPNVALGEKRRRGACGLADPALPIFRTAQQNWVGPLETKALANRAIAPDVPYLGEAFTASAAWHTLRALHAIDSQVPQLLLPVWGLNHQLGLLKLVRR